MIITTIIFDLGSTLIYSPHPWPQVFEKADRAMFGRLKKSGVYLDRKIAAKEFIDYLDDYYKQRDIDLIERRMSELLKTFLASKGFSGLADAEIRDALDVMFTVTQTNWLIEEDALSTLTVLNESGFRLGMISNASDDENVQQLIDHWGLRPFFEFITTSAAVGVRKPHPQIFQAALDYFNVSAGQTAMIGDNLEADVNGANQLGMYSIWITRRTTKQNPNIIPDETVQRLAEIPLLLSKIC